MNMVDMESVKNDYGPVEIDNCPRIYLSSKQVEALGVVGMPAPGSKFMLQAVAEVARVEASTEDDGEKPDVCLSLRLCEVGLAPQAAAAPDAASVLYGGS